MLAKLFWVRDFAPSYAVAWSKMVLGDLDHQGFGKIKWKLVYMCISYLYTYIYNVNMYMYIHIHTSVYGNRASVKSFQTEGGRFPKLIFARNSPEKDTTVPYLEGQGDLVSRPLSPITHSATLLIPITIPLTKSP